VAMRRHSAYTEPMKFWTKLVACFLVAWLPLLGFAAQAGACPEMASSGMSRPVSASPMTGMVPGAQKAPTQPAKAASVCHSPGSPSCGMAVLPATHATLDIPSSPVYRATTPFLVGQFIPEPLQPPPRTL
jgi:hypothetical protein